MTTLEELFNMGVKSHAGPSDKKKERKGRRWKATKGTRPPAGKKMVEEPTTCPKCGMTGRIEILNGYVTRRMGCMTRYTDYSKRVICFDCGYDELIMSRNAEEYFKAKECRSDC